MAITPGLIKTASDGINNPMNIRAIRNNSWLGKINTAGNPFKFEQFTFMWQGYRAGMKILKSLYAEGHHTLQDIISAYAPAGDGNNPIQYAKTVSESSGIPIDTNLAISLNDQDKMGMIVSSMAMVEQGAHFVPNMDDVNTAWLNL